MSIIKQMMKEKATKHDFPEDYDHENGCYENICCNCKIHFYGYKRRIICKVCESVPFSGLPEPKIGPDPNDEIQPCGHKLAFTVTLSHKGDQSKVCMKCMEELLKPKESDRMDWVLKHCIECGQRIIAAPENDSPMCANCD